MSWSVDTVETLVYFFTGVASGILLAQSKDLFGKVYVWFALFTCLLEEARVALALHQILFTLDAQLLKLLDALFFSYFAKNLQIYFFINFTLLLFFHWFPSL